MTFITALNECKNRLKKIQAVFGVVVSVFSVFSIILFCSFSTFSHDTLCHHCIGNLHKSGYICTFHIVYIAVFLFAVLYTLRMNI